MVVAIVKTEEERLGELDISKRKTTGPRLLKNGGAYYSHSIMYLCICNECYVVHNAGKKVKGPERYRTQPLPRTSSSLTTSLKELV